MVGLCPGSHGREFLEWRSSRDCRWRRTREAAGVSLPLCYYREHVIRLTLSPLLYFCVAL